MLQWGRRGQERNGELGAHGRGASASAHREAQGRLSFTVPLGLRLGEDLGCTGHWADGAAAALAPLRLLLLLLLVLQEQRMLMVGGGGRGVAAEGVVMRRGVTVREGGAAALERRPQALHGRGVLQRGQAQAVKHGSLGSCAGALWRAMHLLRPRLLLCAVEVLQGREALQFRGGWPG